MLSLLAMSMGLGCAGASNTWMNPVKPRSVNHFLRAEVMVIIISLVEWLGMDGSWEQEADRGRCVNEEQRERGELENFLCVGAKWACLAFWEEGRDVSKNWCAIVYFLFLVFVPT